MIEGIVGLFVILLLILVVPYIKDWYNRTHNPEDIVKITMSQQGWTQTRRDGSIIVHSNPQPEKPLVGDIWHNAAEGCSYIWNGEEWVPWGKPQKGDVWFW
jgi:hypothetical protein